MRTSSCLRACPAVNKVYGGQEIGQVQVGQSPTRNLFTRSCQTTRRPRNSSYSKLFTTPTTTAIIPLITYHHGGQCDVSDQPRFSRVSDSIASMMRQILTFRFSAIFNSKEDPNSAVSQPVLQCVQVKPLVGQQGAPERFRVVFSDINNFVQSMLATRKHSQLHYF